ncbi:MAG: GTPase Era [Gammaproteobacteria bacterium]|jgi:GTP-binding protein Era|nr:GTPase Era [Gammaproteobacteria bacterium]NBT44667.1 GTPase Era [Gammaproteobacteria bacterium]NBY24092.1 GTPase Era [Gammaproteobacteria bacterium]NDE35019.1 GTPase Era [Gammaproteobacteria bacterium]NDE56989.1 GTPase Era [Gammaproteobacteria bacterium]
MKSGFVAIVGRPNVGKSTLVNHLIGQKICITSRRPQTTRHRIFGIKTTEEGQAVFVDTPGIHASEKRAMNRYLNKAAGAALADVHLVVWVIDRPAFLSEDELVLQRIQRSGAPVILAINKIDRLEDKDLLLPFLQAAGEQHDFRAMIPLSALRGANLQELDRMIMSLLPEGDLIFPEDQVTDRSMRFMAAEIIREKLIRSLGQEVPHALTVEIEEYQLEGDLTRIRALILVERSGQKAIVIGKKGDGLKKVGERARMDLEKLLEGKVFLQLWVKVKEGWSDDERALKSLGYQD